MTTNFKLGKHACAIDDFLPGRKKSGYMKMSLYNVSVLGEFFSRKHRKKQLDWLTTSPTNHIHPFSCSCEKNRLVENGLKIYTLCIPPKYSIQYYDSTK